MFGAKRCRVGSQSQKEIAIKGAVRDVLPYCASQAKTRGTRCRPRSTPWGTPGSSVTSRVRMPQNRGLAAKRAGIGAEADRSVLNIGAISRIHAGFDVIASQEHVSVISSAQADDFSVVRAVLSGEGVGQNDLGVKLGPVGESVEVDSKSRRAFVPVAVNSCTPRKKGLPAPRFLAYIVSWSTVSSALTLMVGVVWPLVPTRAA
jgi:hypothetical protein